jgi:signal peptidase I
MSAAVIDVPAAKPASVLGLVPAAARLVVKAAIGTAVLGLLILAIGPRLYPFQSFYVRTGSMSPVIPVGALVVATRASATELKPGDVIVFRRPDRPQMMVVHRINAIEQTDSGPAFITKGDANGTPDAWLVPATGDGWRAEYSISRAGFVVGWLHAALSRRGWLGGVAIGVAIYLLVVIWRSEEP